MDVKIYPTSIVEGTIELPTSKSQTLRALYSCLFVKGVSIIYNALEADDTEAMIDCIQKFGVKIFKKCDSLCVHSPGFKNLQAPRVCDVRSSGITLRFLSAFAALFNTKITFIGSQELTLQRSVRELEKGLNQLGVLAQSQNGFCPFTVQGPIKKRAAIVNGGDSQPVSALLWLMSSLGRRFELKVLKPKELPWLNLTLSWLDKQNKQILNKDFKKFVVKGSALIQPLIYKVPKDFSSASFMIGIGIFAAKQIKLPDCDFKDPQGDKMIIYLLKQAGANIKRSGNCLLVSRTETLDLSSVSVAKFIDALPVLSACGVISKSSCTFLDAFGARGKESDRISSMHKNFEALGVKSFQEVDSLTVFSSQIHGGVCDGFRDHRIAMSVSILAARSSKPIVIKGAECVCKTYPRFFEDLKAIGMKIEVIQ